MALDRAAKRYLGNIRQFYFTTRELRETGWLDPNKETSLERRIVLLSAFASYESENLTKVSDFLNLTIDQKDQLIGDRRNVRKLKQTKETATSLERSKKSRQQKELEKLRRKKTQESDRLITLEQAAREMEMILARLEKERRKTGVRKRSDEPSFFASLKGRLHSPFKGKITVPFGNSVDKTTNLKSFSPGISIRGRAGWPVYSVAAGSVAYVGDLRGYGNFVIIDHDGIHFTTYAGIARAEVLSGEMVARGTKLGEAGPDGVIKFELYEDKAPITSKNFIDLANSNFYDGLIFHRYEPGFVIQGGDPNGDGTGGSGKTIPLEIHPELRHVKGAVAMARSNDPNSASSQFYITLEASHSLDDNYAVFGQVTEGTDVVEKLRAGDKINKITIK